MASRIPNRSRASRNEEPPTDEQIEEPCNESEALIPYEEEENLPVAVGPRDVSAAEQVAVAHRPWYENLPGWIPRYIREAIIELYKVTWPTTNEAFRLSTVVVVFSVIFAAAFFLVDSGLTAVLQALITRIQH